MMSKWKMVPLEPTDEMIRAIDGLICSSYLWPVYAYRAMIDAAPVQQTDPLGYFTFNKEWNVWEQMSAKYKNASDATPLYLHPPSAELARLRAENERLKAALKPVTRDQINEAVIEVMAQAQSFASSWSLVGGRYDSGDMLDHAHKQKSELERMVRAAIDAAMASGKV